MNQFMPQVPSSVQICGVLRSCECEATPNTCLFIFHSEFMEVHPANVLFLSNEQLKSFVWIKIRNICL